MRERAVWIVIGLNWDVWALTTFDDDFEAIPMRKKPVDRRHPLKRGDYAIHRLSGEQVLVLRRTLLRRGYWCRVFVDGFYKLERFLAWELEHSEQSCLRLVQPGA